MNFSLILDSIKKKTIFKLILIETLASGNHGGPRLFMYLRR